MSIMTCGAAAVLVVPLLLDVTSNTAPRPLQANRGSLTIVRDQRPVVSAPSPPVPSNQDSVPPMVPPPTSTESHAALTQSDNAAATESVPAASPVSVPPTPVAAAPVPDSVTAEVGASVNVDELLSEFAESWEGFGNGSADADGEVSPAYVFASMDSYQRLLRQHRGVIIAFNRATEVRYQLGSSLTPRYLPETFLKSWQDLPGYSKRVCPLPSSDPLVASLRGRFLREHADWRPSQTSLMIAVPQELDDVIQQAQLGACQRRGIVPHSRIVTIGDLAPRGQETEYIIAAIKDVSRVDGQDSVAAR